MEYKIPLNKTDHQCLVSQEDYEHLKQFKYHLNNGYVGSNINKKKWLIHRYIIIELLGNKELTRYNFIDHINGNKLDNRRENLRIVTPKENNQNRIKQKYTSSKYFGVSFNLVNKKWMVQIKINNKRLTALYDNEIFAAHQHNLWSKEHNLNNKLNIIPKKLFENFIPYLPSQKKTKEITENIPKGIYLYKNKYRLIINKTHIGCYDTLKKAIDIRQSKIQEINNKKLDDIKCLPIKRNEKGECIIELFNNKKEKVGETIIDEEIYYDLMKHSWYLIKGNYVKNTQDILLHRYVMNYNDKDFIDHINNNSLDNRKSNLRIVTPRQNAMNKTSHKNSTSKYIGVRFKNNKWEVNINVNNKLIYLGIFKTEIEAAKVRDIATKKYFGEYGNLNF